MAQNPARGAAQSAMGNMRGAYNQGARAAQAANQQLASATNRAIQQGQNAYARGVQQQEAATNAAIQASNQQIQNVNRAVKGVQGLAAAGYDIQQKNYEVAYQTDKLRYENFMMQQEAGLEAQLQSLQGTFDTAENYERQVKEVISEYRNSTEEFTSSKIDQRFRGEFDNVTNATFGQVEAGALSQIPELQRRLGRAETAAMFDTLVSQGKVPQAVSLARQMVPQFYDDPEKIQSTLMRYEETARKEFEKQLEAEAMTTLFEAPDTRTGISQAEGIVAAGYKAMRELNPDSLYYSEDRQKEMLREVKATGTYNILNSMRNGELGYDTNMYKLMEDCEPPWSQDCVIEKFDLPGKMDPTKWDGLVASLKGSARRARDTQRRNFVNAVSDLEDGEMTEENFRLLAGINGREGFAYVMDRGEYNGFEVDEYIDRALQNRNDEMEESAYRDDKKNNPEYARLYRELGAYIQNPDPEEDFQDLMDMYNNVVPNLQSSKAMFKLTSKLVQARIKDSGEQIKFGGLFGSANTDKLAPSFVDRIEGGYNAISTYMEQYIAASRNSDNFDYDPQVVGAMVNAYEDWIKENFRKGDYLRRNLEGEDLTSEAAKQLGDNVNQWIRSATQLMIRNSQNGRDVYAGLEDLGGSQ